MSVSHRRTGTAEYRTWKNMKSRCYNKSIKSYEYYGARGIAVCDRWLNSFENFLSDMGLRPSPSHSIDRKDNSLGYSPDNCTWATKAEQAANRRTFRRRSHCGNGHEYTEDNTYYYLHSRQCRRCNADAATSRRAMNKSERRIRRI